VIAGDITPSTDAERWVSAFVSIIGASIYAYIIGVASGIVGVMNGNKLDLQETVDELNAYMVQEKLPQGTSIRIREYMTFLNKTTGQHTKSIALMDKLSSGLRNDIVDMSFATVLTNVSFLSSKSRTFISRLATLLECKTYAPGEMIAPMHSPASHIYFLTDGVANVNMVELKSAPYHFGEQVLMQSGKYNMTVRAVTYCTFLTLSHQDLWDVLATNKDEFKFMRREVAKMAFRRSVVSTLRGMGAEGVYACSEVRELERLQKKLCDYDTRLQELLAQSTKLHKELGAKLPAYQTFSSSMVNNADLRDGLSTLEKQHHQIVTSSQEELRAQQYKFWKSRRCLEHAITPTTSTIE